MRLFWLRPSPLLRLDAFSVRPFSLHGQFTLVENNHFDGGHMKNDFDVKKVAVLADPRGEEKADQIERVMSQLKPILEQAEIDFVDLIRCPQEGTDMVPADTDLFLVLGGDGTMIHFVARFGQLKIPFYGLNYGNVGFMMNNPSEGLAYHVDKIKSGVFTMKDFPVLKVVAFDLKGCRHIGYGLNDIYLQRMTPQACKVDITINDEPLAINPLLCDGVIVATPLGSTAYSYNVTGTMAAINAPVLTLAPLAAIRSCPVSAIVLPMDTRIGFSILEPSKRRVQVVSDGQNHGDLTHAEISVSRDKRVRLCFDPRFGSRLPIRFINKACE